MNGHYICATTEAHSCSKFTTTQQSGEALMGPGSADRALVENRVSIELAAANQRTESRALAKWAGLGTHTVSSRRSTKATLDEQ